MALPRQLTDSREMPQQAAASESPVTSLEVRGAAPILCGVASLIAVAATLVASAGVAVAAGSAVAFAAFVSPGVLAVRAATGRETGWITPLAFGPVVGFGVSSLALLFLWWAGGRGLWTVAAAPLLAVAIVPAAAALRGRLALVRLERRDLVALALVLLLVPLVVGRPFSRVGAMVEDGKAYRAYFTADYVWRMAVVVELAKGDMPPRNPFYRDDALHYYWLPHLLSGVAYRNLPGRATLDELLLAQSVLMNLAFAAFLYGFVRQFVRSPAGAAAGITAAVLFTSFEGLYMLGRLWHRGVPLEAVRYVNIDAANRWFLGGMPIDGLQRLLLYQPHHAAGYALGLLALLAAGARSRSRDTRVMGVVGLLLGLSMLISTFGAVMLAAAAASYELVGVLRHRDWRRLGGGLAAAVPIAAAYALVQRLEYVDRAGGPLVQLGVNPVATSNALVSIGLSFGPVLVPGVVGAVVALRRRDGTLAPVAALVAVAVFFYFFVDVLDHQGVYVGWRAGHFMFVALAVLVGIAVQALEGATPRVRAAGIAGLVLLAMGATPTTAIDLYNTQDTANRTRGPGFPWTLVLSHVELPVLEWIRNHTPPDALVQADPVARDPNSWAYVPAFAERRMAIGLPISMIPRAKYEEGSQRMHRIYVASDAREAHAIAVDAGVDYLLVGPQERAVAPGCEERFAAAAGLFEPVIRTSQLSVFRVLRPAANRSVW